MRRTPLLAAAAALALLGSAVAPAQALRAGEAEELAGGLAMPLSLAVAEDGTVYFSENFPAGEGDVPNLNAVVPGGEVELVYADEQMREVGAVSVTGDVVTFATTALGGPPSAHVYQLDTSDPAAEPVDRANLWSMEEQVNPDGRQTYGLKGLSKSCKATIRKKKRLRPFLPYRGIVESHPYATYVDGERIFVADAAANAIFVVEGETVDTLAVLPATKITVRKKIRKATGLPKCAQGKTLRVEGVPTDVEMGPDGNLYVTSLPGGPEIPAMGANGAIYRIAPGTGAITRMSSGLVSPTGLAIGPDGTAYISMLFAQQILAVPFGGEPSVFAEVAGGPGDVEIADGYLYATEAGMLSETGEGKVLRRSLASGRG